MKLVHLSDLHIGKRVNEFSMIEDQQYILMQILGIIDEVEPQGVIIAGDVYDKPVPSAEAVQLFDDFLYRLSKRNLQVLIISGNHDSPERIAFGSRLMSSQGIHLSPVYSGKVEPVTLSDEYGEVNLYMLPFVKPAHVRRFFADKEIASYTDAMRVAVDNMNIDESKRNVLITHQFVTGATRSESEDISVGGTDNVDVSVFDSFDYVALGHLHSPQNCKSERVRYCGTPLKYSFSEANDKKSVTVVELCEKGSLSISTVPLTPMRDMKEIRGTYQEIMAKKFYKDTTYKTDYMHITLTDEEDVPNALGLLRTVYTNLMKLDYDNKRTRQSTSITGATDVERKSPLELFADFYEEQNNQPMSDEQNAFMLELIEEIWEDEE
ncbi:MAG: exonuclease SbcCD subunit D [Ruminococcus sp.]|nr:exonuclease SbcCD subunit D [Ruminococcus sp.]